MKNKPLFERYTTVTGKQLKKPGNFLVRMGTPFGQLIDLCGGLPDGDNKILAGGPMMGKAVNSLNTPVGKGQNSITVLSDMDAHRKEPQPCIRCAKCVGACPMGLDVKKMVSEGKLSGCSECIECGACIDTCPKKVLKYKFIWRR